MLDKQIGYFVFRPGFALVATKAEEVPDDEVNSLFSTPLLRHQLFLNTLNKNTYCTICRHTGWNINALIKPEALGPQTMPPFIRAMSQFKVFHITRLTDLCNN